MKTAYSSITLFFSLFSTTGAFAPLSEQSAITRGSVSTQLQDSTMASSVPVMPVATKDDNVVNVLALYDAEGQSSAFTSTLNNWRDQLLLKHGKRMEITVLEAPIRHGRGFAWWEHVDENDEKLNGFEESADHVLQAVEAEPFDVVFGHGQGAALTTALLLQEKIKNHPNIGYILNNPSIPPESIDADAAPSFDDKDKPNILLLTGMRDTVTPESHSQTIKERMAKAGAQVKEIKHPKGHAVPIQDDATLRLALEWIVEAAEEA